MATARNAKAAAAATAGDQSSAETPKIDGGAEGNGTATTTLDSDVTKPSVTAPGDGPADTTDPTETAHSVQPSPGEEAIKTGTVNAVKPGLKRTVPKTTRKPRTESYTATRPDGTEVTVTRNIETGESSVSE
ncbi:hypothetical protein LJ753_10905 [Arthrobacter sp. zg-Y20]|uniref:hypothetical protein n=1 Tax=unclassified Arthrobacter TaxID=235627 RepID=UPI001D144B79|nr:MULTISPECIES: hypothetical protein [unclassified Arthrobacter]MCC3276379.1 hypothetical protein [Arthrobacter sp. zg-Y20]MDK1316538.1 hypothetical protein [Arthrobacter sp. zg.Y20]WIB06578.1 hypothetical protein QNO06_02205 [Arthrobacter sp. zg-Y20]